MPWWRKSKLTAQISRIFPDKLIVTIKEKHPLLVVRLRDKERGLADWLISADGSVYRGEGYPNQGYPVFHLFESLPVS